MTTPEEIANAQSQKGTFSLVERLQGRNMPEEDVDIYLDENLGWELVRLEEEHANAKNDARATFLESKIADVKERLKASKYVFTLRGMTNEEYDRIIDEVEEAHPIAYEEGVNALTGQKFKTEVENPERDALFNTLLLASVITKVTDPDGAVDENIDAATVAYIKRLAPLDAIRMITTLAMRMRMAVEWMDAIQNEDFSPRP